MEDDPLGDLANRMPTWMTVILGMVMIPFLIWGFSRSYITGHARDKNPRYTIGYVKRTDYAIGPSSHSVSFFTYTARGHPYAKSSDGDLEPGCTRCLVKYADDDPINCEFFNHVCIPDSITQAPKEGWQKPPFSVPGYVE